MNHTSQSLRFGRFAFASLVLAMPAWAQDGAATKPSSQPSDTAAQTKFARLSEGPAGDPKSLDVAVTEYTDAKGRRVDLVGAVHIADPQHYRDLQELFTAYDAMLYELVAPADFRPYPGMERGGTSPVSMLQRGLKRGLELEFQLDAVDYRPENLVHADLTPREFEELQEEKGETLLSLLWSSYVAEQQRMREEAEAADEAGVELKGEEIPNLVNAFRSGEGRHTLRVLFAKLLQNVEKVAAGFGDKGEGSVLVEGRNEKAFVVLDKRLAAGDKMVGIYYGAAHLPDMEDRLIQRGFKLTGQRWLRAWDLTKRMDPKFKGRNSKSDEGGAASKPASDGKR